VPDPSALGASLLLLVVIAFLVWFALGTQINIRRGNAILTWLQGGLPLLGRRTTLRWLGSSAVELKLVEPLDPFREASVIIVLEPRDVGWLWAFARARGRRDFIIVRASLRRAPRVELSLTDPAGWTSPGRPVHDERAGIGDPEAAVVALPPPSAGIHASGSPGLDPVLVARVWASFQAAAGGVWQVTVQPTVPHLEVHVLPPAMAAVPSERLIDAIRDLAANIGRDQRATG
jgi:hypothetical protein